MVRIGCSKYKSMMNEQRKLCRCNHLLRQWIRTYQKERRKQRDQLKRGPQRVHHRLIRFILEISIPQRVELGAHLLKLFLGGTNLYDRCSANRQPTSITRGLTLKPASIALDDKRAFSGLTSHSLKSYSMVFY